MSRNYRAHCWIKTIDSSDGSTSIRKFVLMKNWRFNQDLYKEVFLNISARARNKNNRFSFEATSIKNLGVMTNCSLLYLPHSAMEFYIFLKSFPCFSYFTVKNKGWKSQRKMLLSRNIRFRINFTKFFRVLHANFAFFCLCT